VRLARKCRRVSFRSQIDHLLPSYVSCGLLVQYWGKVPRVSNPKNNHSSDKIARTGHNKTPHVHKLVHRLGLTPRFLCSRGPETRWNGFQRTVNLNQLSEGSGHMCLKNTAELGGISGQNTEIYRLVQTQNCGGSS